MFLELSEAMNLHQDECYSIFNVTINFQISCLDFLRVIAIKIIQYNVKKKNWRDSKHDKFPNNYHFLFKGESGYSLTLVLQPFIMI